MPSSVANGNIFKIIVAQLSVWTYHYFAFYVPSNCNAQEHEKCTKYLQ